MATPEIALLALIIAGLAAAPAEAPAPAASCGFHSHHGSHCRRGSGANRPERKP
jgi:hypothetical protein